MYDGTSVRILVREIGMSPITIGLHQRSTLNPCLFALILDDFTMFIQNEIPMRTLSTTI